jgi:prevent-host-death family protein
MAELRVGTRELKNRLSQYLRRVKAGETLVITEHGRPVGQIFPIQSGEADQLKMLTAANLVEWNGSSLPPYQPQAVNTGKGLISDLVVEQRE